MSMDELYMYIIQFSFELMNNVELYVYVYMDKQCNTLYVGSFDIWGCTLIYMYIIYVW